MIIVFIYLLKCPVTQLASRNKNNNNTLSTGIFRDHGVKSRNMGIITESSFFHRIENCTKYSNFVLLHNTHLSRINACI